MQKQAPPSHAGHYRPESLRRSGWLAALISLSGLLLACQLSSVVLTPSPTEAAKTAVASEMPITSTNAGNLPSMPTMPAMPGSSRAYPIPQSQTAVAGQWAVTVLDAVRGDDAWQEIHLANANNPPAPTGWEYLLVDMTLENRSDSEDNEYVGLHVTGDGRVVHFSFNSGVVPPDPALASDLPGGVASTGWAAYLIREGEGNLMLVVEDYAAFDTPTAYLAIDEDAAITIDRATMLSIAPTDLGLDRNNPVPFGQTATAEDWQIIVEDVISGPAAWEIILDANQFNDPPPEGMVYVLVKVRVRYIGLSEDEQNVGDRDFTLFAGSGEALERPSVVEPEPELFFDLYAGGEVEGWIVLQAPAEAQDWVLYFNPAYDGSGVNGRYLSLGQGR